MADIPTDNLGLPSPDNIVDPAAREFAVGVINALQSVLQRIPVVDESQSASEELFVVTGKQQSRDGVTRLFGRRLTIEDGRIVSFTPEMLVCTITPGTGGGVTTTFIDPAEDQTQWRRHSHVDG